MSEEVSETATPVGGSLRIALPRGSRHRAWASAFWITGPQLDRRVHTGSPGSCAAALADSGPAETRRFSQADGEVAVIASANHTVGVAWTGPHHELYYYLQSDRPDVDEAASFLGGLDIQDSAEGIVVRPRRGRGLVPRRLQMFTWVEGAFAMSVFHGAEHAQLLPAWRGRSVAGGELWRQSLPGEGGTGLLLGTPSAVVTLDPDPGPEAQDRTLAAADRMIVEYLDVPVGTR